MESFKQSLAEASRVASEKAALAANATSATIKKTGVKAPDLSALGVSTVEKPPGMDYQTVGMNLLSLVTNKYLTLSPDSRQAHCNADVPGPNQVFYLVPEPKEPNLYAVRNEQGQFLVTETDGQVTARGVEIMHEKFRLYHSTATGNVKLATKDDKVVYVRTDGKLFAERTKQDGRNFKLLWLDGEVISLKSKWNRFFTIGDEKRTVTCDALAIQAGPEKFTVVHASGGKLALRTCNKRFIAAENNGALIINEPSEDGVPAPPECFDIVTGEYGFCIRSMHGKFFCAEKDFRVSANRGFVGSFENWEVVTHRAGAEGVELHAAPRRGWLTKEAGGTPLAAAGGGGAASSTWKRRWFSVEKAMLSWSGEQGSSPLGCVNMGEATGVIPVLRDGHPHCLRVMLGPSVNHDLSCDTVEERNAWVETLRRHMGNAAPSVQAGAGARRGARERNQDEKDAEKIEDERKAKTAMSGILKKKQMGPFWAERFVYYDPKGGTLTYFKQEGDKQPRGFLVLENCNVKRNANLLTISRPFVAKKKLQWEEIYFMTETKEEMDPWYFKIKASVQTVSVGKEREKRSDTVASKIQPEALQAGGRTLKRAPRRNRALRRHALSVWVSTVVAQRGLPPMANVVEHLCDGTVLVHLFELLFGTVVLEAEEQPGSDVELWFANIATVLAEFTNAGVVFKNKTLVPQDFVERNERVVLDALWDVAFAAMKPVFGGRTMKEGELKDELMKRVSGIAGEAVTNLSHAFEDGTLLANLVHKRSPAVCPLSELERNRSAASSDDEAARKNLELALGGAAQIGIPAALDAAMICGENTLGGERGCDEIAIIMWLALYNNAHAKSVTFLNGLQAAKDKWRAGLAAKKKAQREEEERENGKTCMVMVYFDGFDDEPAAAGVQFKTIKVYPAMALMLKVGDFIDLVAEELGIDPSLLQLFESQGRMSGRVLHEDELFIADPYATKKEVLARHVKTSAQKLAREMETACEGDSLFDAIDFIVQAGAAADNDAAAAAAAAAATAATAAPTSTPNKRATMTPSQINQALGGKQLAAGATGPDADASANEDLFDYLDSIVQSYARASVHPSLARKSVAPGAASSSSTTATATPPSAAAATAVASASLSPTPASPAASKRPLSVAIKKRASVAPPSSQPPPGPPGGALPAPPSQVALPPPPAGAALPAPPPSAAGSSSAAEPPLGQQRPGTPIVPRPGNQPRTTLPPAPQQRASRIQPVVNAAAPQFVTPAANAERTLPPPPPSSSTTTTQPPSDDVAPPLAAPLQPTASPTAVDPFAASSVDPFAGGPVSPAAAASPTTQSSEMLIDLGGPPLAAPLQPAPAGDAAASPKPCAAKASAAKTKPGVVKAGPPKAGPPKAGPPKGGAAAAPADAGASLFGASAPKSTAAVSPRGALPKPSGAAAQAAASKLSKRGTLCLTADRSSQLLTSQGAQRASVRASTVARSSVIDLDFLMKGLNDMNDQDVTDLFADMPTSMNGGAGQANGGAANDGVVSADDLFADMPTSMSATPAGGDGARVQSGIVMADDLFASIDGMDSMLNDIALLSFD